MRSGVTVRSFPLRIHLIALALAAGLPTAILTGVLLFRSINLDRAALENRLIQVAEDLANDLDRDLDRHLTVLRTLAALPSLTAEDWPAFYAQAKGAVEGKGYVLVIDSSLRQLVNTRLPYGQAPRITGDPETARHVIETKEPAVSNLFFSLIDGIPVFNVNVPIVRDGKVRFILIYGHKADDLVPILLGQKLDPQWVTAVLDRNGTLLARSKSHAQLVGKRYALFDDELAAPDFTIRRTTSLEGDRVLRVLVRSKFSGWLVMAALPVDAAEGLLRSRLVWWGLITLVALLSSIALASWLARHMARAFAAAEAAAIALGHGQPIAVVQSSLVEANTIIAAEARAQAELEARATHHRLLMHELSHRVKNVLAVVQAMVRRTLSQQRSISDARAVLTDRLMALTRAHDALMRTDWKGAPLKEIVLAELAPFTTRVSIGVASENGK